MLCLHGCMCTVCLQRLEECYVESSGTEIADRDELSYGCWELNQAGPFQGQQVFLTTKISLQPVSSFLKFIYFTHGCSFPSLLFSQFLTHPLFPSTNPILLFFCSGKAGLLWITIKQVSSCSMTKHHPMYWGRARRPRMRSRILRARKRVRDSPCSHY